VEINIRQKKISYTDEYEISVSGKIEYIVVSEALRKTAKINFYNYPEENLILKIEKKNFGIRANYLIEELNKKQIYSFEEINNIKLIFKCQIDDDYYQLYGHNYNKYSIFKNQKQVAFWEKNNFIFGEQDFYKITANDNENVLILSAFCICIDNGKNNFQNELNIFNFDLGFKGNLVRKFDSEWKPNG